MKKGLLTKVLALILVVGISVSAGVAGTMAYLTKDAGTEVNTFQVGELDVYLEEEVGVLGEGGEVKETETGAEYIEIMPGDYLKKTVTVTNEGDKDAYVRVLVTLNNADKINSAIDDVYENAPYSWTADQIQEMYNFIFDGWGINYNPRPGVSGKDDARGVIDGTYGLPEYTLNVDFSKTTSSSTVIGNGNWFVAGNEKQGQYWVDNSRGEGKVDNGYYTKNMEDYEICYAYYLHLPAGESTTLFNGLNVPAEFNNAQMEMFNNLTIDIDADAIQADNMGVAEIYAGKPNGKAKTAFAILAGDIEVPEYSNKPSGDLTPAYASMVGHTTWNSIWGEAYTNAKESLVLKLYSGETLLGTNSLNDFSRTNVTWHFYFNDEDIEKWDLEWEQKPTVDLMPTHVELWVDGEKLDVENIRLSAPDNLNPITGAVINTNQEIIKYTTKSELSLGEGESYVPFVSSSDELKDALKDEVSVILLKDGEYNWNGTGHIGVSQTVSIYGESKNAILYHTFEGEGNTDYDFDGYTVNFYNLTISGEKNGASYPGWARMSATYNDCVIKQTYGLYAGTHEFNYCTLNVTGDQYNIWTWGAEEATFNDCTFNSDGKAILLYGQANTKLTINNCVFNDNGGLSDLKAAVEIGNDYGKSYELIVNNTVVNGYEINDKGINTGTTLWGNKNSMGPDKLNVVVDGVDVY